MESPPGVQQTQTDVGQQKEEEEAGGEECGESKHVALTSRFDGPCFVDRFIYCIYNVYSLSHAMLSSLTTTILQ
jgi:hypothetical protein